jgi:DNA-binding CsgD family transcriptional regulator
MCVFGIYGIWGMVFVKFVLEQITISNRIITIISQAIPYIGFPFLIMAWYMFLKLCYELSGSKISSIVSTAYFFFLLFFFIGLGWLIVNLNDETSGIPGIGLIYVFMVMDVVLTSWGLLFLLFQLHRTAISFSKLIKRYIMISFLFLFLKVASVIIFNLYPISVPVFILLYFLSIVFPLIYFYYNINYIIASVEGQPSRSSQEHIIARYGITKREREIIKHVCSGKSNQEIADTLFISLQTVKDHTHRIYLKMDIKSRVQLIKMMQVN